MNLTVLLILELLNFYKPLITILEVSFKLLFYFLYI
jgi:hypothetical protein